jgi:glycosyltransferase involved in cell wall biosynthesis
MAAPTEPPHRPRILFHAGRFSNNGITVAFLSLLNAVVQYDVDIVVATDAKALLQSPELFANLQKLPPGVTLIHREDDMTLSAKERTAFSAYYRNNRFETPDQETCIRQALLREVARLFGDQSFDCVAEFAGYSRFWAMLLASVPARRHLIWQHSDLLANAHQDMPILYGVFAVYRWFDRVVNGGAASQQTNLQNLGHYFPSADAAVVVRNLIDPVDIRAKAAQPLAPQLVRRSTAVRFTTIGRLAPEKAQSRAIHATAALVRAGHDIELLMIGDGPLHAEFTTLIATLGMTDRISLAGHIDNPFPALADSDCFILPSDREGHAMVVLEALTLGIPIIASDIPSIRAQIGDMQGCLVDQSVEGVTAGMLAFLDGKVTASAFDPAAYRQAALDDFFVHAFGLPAAPSLTPPVVTVVMPVYNAAEYIVQAISSVQAQSLTAWELYAVEDGSTDDSLAILHGLASHDRRIHVISGGANQGPGPARNAGIRAATGRYIAFLDADDLWHPEKLARQIGWMQANNSALSCTAYTRVTVATGTTTPIGVPAQITRADLLKTNTIACSSAIYDTTHFGLRQMPALPKRQDFAFWLDLLQNADAHGLNENLMTYHARPQSVSSAKGQAAAHTWRMYRHHLGLSLPRSTWYFTNYALRGLIRTRAPALARTLGWLQAVG